MLFRTSLVLLGGVLLLAGWKTLDEAGAFDTLEYHSDLDCTPILGVWSSEDITIDTRTGRAYISATDRRPRPDGRSPGAIYAFDIRAGNVRVVEMADNLEGDFRPHGLSLLREGGRLLLFAVNHRSDRDSVEIFEVDGSRLQHLETVVHERFYNLNDVAAIAPDTFYVTRDHGGLSRAGRWIEDVLALPLSSVLLVDTGRVRQVADGISYANGINVSADKGRLYVAGTRDRAIHVFDRDQATGGLSFVRAIETGTAVDNIEVDEDGSLWVGAHPKVLDFQRYAADPEELSPSQVLRIRPDDPEEPVEQVLLSDGRFLSGSSVAARWGEFVLVGSVFDRRFLFCEANGLTPAGL